MGDKEHPSKRITSQLSRAQKKAMLVNLLKKISNMVTRLDPFPIKHSFTDDAKLDASITPVRDIGPVEFPQTVLLTGATGFLGAHLLHDLLRLSTAKVYALVRASGLTCARRRLGETAARYGLSLFESGRIHLVLGDIGKPKLGLGESDHASIAAEVDAIYHSAAQVNHVIDYEQLRACNVGGTIEVLKMATQIKTKQVYYISTLVSSVDRDSEGYLLERFPEADSAELIGGYAQTKWVSEKLLGEAHQRGLPVSIFRTGHIAGRSDTGACPAQKDHLLGMVKGCIQLGNAPEFDYVIETTPVDFISEAIIRFSLDAQARGLVVNLCNPHPVTWPQIIEWVNKLGYSVRMMPIHTWQEQLPKTIDEGNALLPWLSLHIKNEALAQRMLLIGKQGKVRRETALSLLNRHDLRYPEINMGLWKTYFQRLREDGFLDDVPRSNQQKGVVAQLASEAGCRYHGS